MSWWCLGGVGSCPWVCVRWPHAVCWCVVLCGPALRCGALQEGLTAAHHAATYGNDACLAPLIQVGCDLTAKTKVSAAGWWGVRERVERGVGRVGGPGRGTWWRNGVMARAG